MSQALVNAATKCQSHKIDTFYKPGFHVIFHLILHYAGDIGSMDPTVCTPIGNYVPGS